MALKIGNTELPGSVILAPMAGVSDLPFRLLCHEQGADLVCMEMVSAKAIAYHNRNTEKLMQIHPAEGPVSLQLFGSEPELMAEIARQIEERPFDILDINMGCPVPKIVGNGEGSALMREPKLVEVNAVEIARIAEGSGAAAVAVHGRTREQYYSGRADWDIIRQVKEAVSIPVIGNGDVDSPKKAKAMLEETGCDGVMIGRAARGNPWIFRQVQEYLRTGVAAPKPSPEEVRAIMLRHARMQVEYKGDYTGIREMRKHISWYTAGMPHSARLRARINSVESLEELEEILTSGCC